MRRSLILLATFSLAACTRESARTDTAAARDTVGQAGTSTTRGGGATAAVRNAQGRELGTLTVTDTTGGITVAGSLAGLPAGEHGIHVHTTGRCEPPFESAGSHWNPTAKQHGFENPQGPHLGDMTNITASADSSAGIRLTTRGGTLRGENALLDSDGAAVVVHEKADDYRTDPSGNSGARIACGVISAR